MADGVSIKIEGLDAVATRLKAENLVGAPLRKGFTKVGFFLESEAKKRAPVRTGLLRGSITYAVDPAILGGLLVTIKNQSIDLSAASRLVEVVSGGRAMA